MGWPRRRRRSQRRAAARHGWIGSGCHWIQRWRTYLGGGEDFELVLALDPDWARTLLTRLSGSSVIGTLTAGAAGSLGWSDGTAWPAPTPAAAGFQHFR